MNSRSGFNFGALEADIFCARFAPHGNQDFFGVDLLLFSVNRNGDGDASLCLLNLVNLRAGVKVNTALAEDARQFLRDFFVFNRNEPGEHFNNGHFAIERAIDRRELHSDRSCADNDDRLRNVLQAEDFNIGQHAITGFQARQSFELPTPWRESRSSL